MSEHQSFERSETYCYTSSWGDETAVTCVLTGRLEDGKHVPCSAKVFVSSGERARFELLHHHINGLGVAWSPCLVVTDSNLQTDFELMAYAMKALADLMTEEITAYWSHSPNGYEKPGTWVYEE